jgi:hypothetical protein
LKHALRTDASSIRGLPGYGTIRSAVEFTKEGFHNIKEMQFFGFSPSDPCAYANKDFSPAVRWSHYCSGPILENFFLGLFLNKTAIFMSEGRKRSGGALHVH